MAMCVLSTKMFWVLTEEVHSNLTLDLNSSFHSSPDFIYKHISLRLQSQCAIQILQLILVFNIEKSCNIKIVEHQSNIFLLQMNYRLNRTCAVN